jgi:hypothetical protein
MIGVKTVATILSRSSTFTMPRRIARKRILISPMRRMINALAIQPRTFSRSWAGS